MKFCINCQFYKECGFKADDEWDSHRLVGCIADDDGVIIKYLYVRKDVEVFSEKDFKFDGEVD